MQELVLIKEISKDEMFILVFSLVFSKPVFRKLGSSLGLWRQDLIQASLQGSIGFGNKDTLSQMLPLLHVDTDISNTEFIHKGIQ